jgi:acyl carrier protein
LQNMPHVPPYFASFAHLKPTAEQLPGSTASSSAATAGAAGAGSGSALAAMDAEQRLEYLLAEVESAAKGIIGGSVSANEPLMAAGLDSLGAVELRNSLESGLGMQLPSTLVFDYPTITAIAGFVNDSLAPATAPAAAAAGPLTTEQQQLGSELALADGAPALLAVTGIATRSPVGALEQHTLLDAMAAIPVSRWDAELQLTQDMPARFGGFVPDAYLFDAAAFSITGTEAALMDPQQRLLLECTEEALAAARLSVLGAVAGKAHAAFVHYGAELGRCE